MSRYEDTTQLATVWIELLQFVQDKLRALHAAGAFEGIAVPDHIEIRKFPFVNEADRNDHQSGIFVVPAPENRFDQLTTNVNQGLRLGVMVSAWKISDGDLFNDIGRILRWRGQMWKPQNGLNISRYVLPSASVYAELEPGPVFDAGAWGNGIDQTTMMIRVLTRSALV